MNTNLITGSFDDPHISPFQNPSEPPEADQSVSIPGHLLLGGHSRNLCAGFWACAFRRHTSQCCRWGSGCWRINKICKIYTNNYYRFLSQSDVSLKQSQLTPMQSSDPAVPCSRTFVSWGAGSSTSLLSLQVFLVADRTHAVGAGVTVETTSHSTKHWHLRLIGLLSHALAKGGWGGGGSRCSLKNRLVSKNNWKNHWYILLIALQFCSEI